MRLPLYHERKACRQAGRSSAGRPPYLPLTKTSLSPPFEGKRRRKEKDRKKEKAVAEWKSFLLRHACMHKFSQTTGSMAGREGVADRHCTKGSLPFIFACFASTALPSPHIKYLCEKAGMGRVGRLGWKQHLLWKNNVYVSSVSPKKAVRLLRRRGRLTFSSSSSSSLLLLPLPTMSTRVLHAPSVVAFASF